MMIVIIVLAILLIPRYNKNGHSIRKVHNKPSLQKKMPDESDEFELPLTGIFSIKITVPYYKLNERWELNSAPEALIYRHYTHIPVLPVCGYIHFT